MAEANEAEPNERAAPSPRRPRRTHVINLCCAQSVQGVVEEVARNLETLGFGVTVVCGAEARAALLGSRTDSDQPTIHVVCVQGSMQERVLKPLRQALATHGGPNHHLFVAVLDLGVPLAMVGQIRRFAEALERATPPTPLIGGAAEANRDLEQSPTRAYPSVAQVVERGNTKPPTSSEGDDAEAPRRRTRPLTARGRAAKIAPTSKYREVTASETAVQPEPAVRKRRRERSRLSPSARRRAPAAPEQRVLGLPEQDTSRHEAGAAQRREQQPPPPPPPGELGRRRASSDATQAAPPPPALRPPQVGPRPGIDEPTAPHRRAPEATAGAGQAPRPPPVPDADRPLSRTTAGFRFTPPGVKTAEVRPPGPPVTTVPLAEVLPNADKTMVQGVIAEVPRTASTLRLDEPPFKDGPVPRTTTLYGDDKAPRAEAPVEPTMILPAPTPSAAPRPAPSVARGQPAASDKTVVGPPPQPSPEALAELERVRREVAAETARGQARAATPTATSPAPRPDAESSGLVLRPRSALLDSEPLPAASPPSTAARPGTTSGSAESSGTLVLRPRSTSDATPTSDTSATLPLARPRGASETSGTLGLRLRTGKGSTAPPDSGPSGTVVLQMPTGGAAEVSETEKTLRREDGTFETTKTVMQKIEASRRGLAQPGEVDDDEPPIHRHIDLEPEDLLEAPPSKPSKTVPYFDPGSAAPAKSESTVVTPAPTPAVPTQRPADAKASAASVAEGDQPGAPRNQASPSAVPTQRHSDAPSSRPPSAVPTERHPMAEPETPGRGRKRKAVSAKAEEDAGQDRPSSASGTLDVRPEPRRKGRAERRASTGPQAHARARGKKASSLGWVWILLVLLTAGGGIGSYQAGLFDGLLGRPRSEAMVADASDDPSKTVAAEAGQGEGPAAEGSATPTELTAAAAETADGGSAEAGTGPDETSAAVVPPRTSAADEESGTGEPTTAGDDGSTGGPGPVPTTSPADGPAADDGPTEPETTGDEPIATSDGAEGRLTAQEEILAAAAEQRRLFMLKTLFATRRQGTATTFAGATLRCAKLEIDGVKGWRLPHRRQLKLINAVLALPSGTFWTRTVPREDPASSYVLDSVTGELSLAPKDDPSGEVLCVRRRAHPDQ